MQELSELLNFGAASRIAFSVVFAGLMLFFLYTMFYRLQLMMLAKAKEVRWDNLGARMVLMFKYAIAQYKMPQDLLPGLLHVAVFYGFLTVSLRTVMLTIVLITGDSGFDLWILGHDNILGQLYALGKDIMTIVVGVSVLWLAWRRVVTRPKRLKGIHTVEATMILLWIFVLMLSDYLVEASHIRLQGSLGIIAPDAGHWYMPFASLGTGMLSGMTNETLALVFKVNVWIHICLVWTFLNYLPYGKHFHVLLAIPNVFMGRMTPNGRLSPIKDIEQEFEKEEPRLGVKDLKDLSWKHLFDVYTCTECGRCVTECPAFDTDKPLSLRQLNMTIKEYLYKEGPALLATTTAEGGHQGPQFTGEVIKTETIWACTMCRDCEQRCPVLIEQVPRIADMRRHLVMMEGDIPAELNNVFKGWERNSNPWNLGMDKRGDWITEGVDAPVFAEMSPEEQAQVEYLFYVGCMGSFDDRSIRITKSFIHILNKAGVKFAVLGMEESCCGETARRLGNEFLGQVMMQALVETINQYKVKKIVATCPHCFNTLKNEYPDFGGKWEVIHSHHLLADLIAQGRIKLTKAIDATITYHDSCFLGRYNDVYDEPRDLIRAIPGLKLAETRRHGHEAYCCGAGGGRMWMEEHQPRVNQKRFDELFETKPCLIGTSCPYCNTMVTDGAKAREQEENLKVKDLVELVEEAME